MKHPDDTPAAPAEVDAYEIHELAREIADTEQLPMGAALSKARRLAPDLIAYMHAWNRIAERSRSQRPPTA